MSRRSECREGQRGALKLACVYYAEEPGRRSTAKLLTKDEARRIAANVATLQERYCAERNVRQSDVRFRG
jgi:hypothetical protein